MILNRDEFFSRINERLGSDTSEESIAFLEDMTDTYNDLSNRANGDGVDWKSKCEELDEAWKKKYQSRFFTGHSNMPENRRTEPDEKIGYDDLFK